MRELRRCAAIVLFLYSALAAGAYLHSHSDGFFPGEHSDCQLCQGAHAPAIQLAEIGVTPELPNAIHEAPAPTDPAASTLEIKFGSRAPPLS